METEVMCVKRRFFESRQKVKMLKDMLSDQRTKSRKIIVSCALKLQEKEKEIDEVGCVNQVRGTFEACISTKKGTVVYLLGNAISHY